MQMIVVADTKAAVTVVEEVNLVKVASLAKESLVKAVAQEVLGNVAMRTVKPVCTTAVHLAVALISLVLVKNSVKKVQVRVVLARVRVKIALQVANLGVNLVKNSPNPVKF
jgi:multidrug transporter EmrE-like cation transporter